MRHYIIQALAVLMLPLSSLCGMAQKVYTLDECLQQALRSNIAVRRANTDIDMSRETVASARAHYLPSVSAVVGGFGSSTDNLHIDIPPITNIVPFGNLGIAKNGALAGVMATMPVYAGGQIHNSNKLADLGVEVSQLRLAQSQSDVRLTTARYYWQVVLLKEKLKTINVVDSLLASIHNKVEAAVKAGVTLRNDLLKVDLKQNEMQSARLQVEDGVKMACMQLSQYIGLGLDTLSTAYEMDYALPLSPLSLYVQPSEAVVSTAEYQLLTQNVRAQELQERVTYGKNLPKVLLGAMADYENVNVNKRIFDSRIDHSSIMGFAAVVVPISEWIGGSHDVRRQKAAVAKAKMQRDDDAELLRLNMTNRWNKLNESYNQLSVCLKSIEQSKENLRLQMNQYQAGVCTMSDLLEAETLYQQSRDNFAEHMVAYQIRKAEYLRAIGE